MNSVPIEMRGDTKGVESTDLGDRIYIEIEKEVKE